MSANLMSISMGGSVAENGNLAGIKVMVIDDSNTIRRSAEIFLVQSGCEVILVKMASMPCPRLPTINPMSFLWIS